MRPFMARSLYSQVAWLRREPVLAAMRDLRRAQWLPRERLGDWQWERLQRVIGNVTRSVPFYADFAEKTGFKASRLQAPADLARLPIVTKSMLRTQRDRLLSREYRGPVSDKTTGGSTGEAVTIRKDRTATAFARGAMWRNYEWWGIRIGDKQGRFWGIPITLRQRLRYRVIDSLSNRIRLASFNFSEQDMFNYYRRIRRFAPSYLYGYASMIREFAVFLRRNGLKLSVPNVITTSEVLYPAQRKVIHDVLHGNVIDEYGCGEVGPIAFECPSGSLHLMADNLYFEILKDDGTEAQEGEIGELIVTELHSRAMPLVRYRLMDFVEVGTRHCECGRGLPTIRRVIGRAYDYLVAKDGRRFHGEKVMYLLERLQDRKMGVRQMQVVQTAVDRLTIRLMNDSSPSRQAIGYIQSYFTKALGQDVKIDYETVERIPRERSGKIRIVACEMRE